MCINHAGHIFFFFYTFQYIFVLSVMEFVWLRVFHSAILKNSWPLLARTVYSLQVAPLKHPAIFLHHNKNTLFFVSVKDVSTSP